jgi:hypothetical protein
MTIVQNESLMVKKGCKRSLMCPSRKHVINHPKRVVARKMKMLRACLGPSFFPRLWPRLRLSETWFPSKPTPMGFGMESHWVTVIRFGLDSFQFNVLTSFFVFFMQLWYGYVQKWSTNIVRSCRQRKTAKKVSCRVLSLQLQLQPKACNPRYHS